MSVDYEARVRARQEEERDEIRHILEDLCGDPLADWAVRINAHDIASVRSDILLDALRRAHSIINGEG